MVFLTIGLQLPIIAAHYPLSRAHHFRDNLIMGANHSFEIQLYSDGWVPRKGGRESKMARFS